MPDRDGRADARNRPAHPGRGHAAPTGPSPAAGRRLAEERGRGAAVLGRWGSRALAALTGACLALAFPPVGAWWWAWTGLVPLLILSARAGTFREAAWRGWFAAAGFFAVLQHWVLPSLGVFAPPAVALVGLVWMPFGLVAYAFLRRPTPARLLAAAAVLPSVWVAVEALRSWRHLGGTWGLLGVSQWQTWPVLAVAALGGVWLLSFLLVAANVGLTAVVLPAALRTRLVGGGVALVLIAAAVGYGLTRPPPAVTGTMRVGGVQAGFAPGAERRLADHLAMTAELAGHAPDVVVWGQSSVALDPTRRPRAERALRRAAAATGGDLLVNVDAADPSGRITKAAYHYTADGLAGRYVKRRLVPFGEYVPLRPLLGRLGDHTGAAERDRATGDAPAVFEISGRRVGPLVSYESTFPDLRRELARMGADITIVQGSLATFHGSWAQPQQASFEAVRAVETGRPAVLVQISGVSAAFDARGGRLAWVPAGYRGVFVADVPLSREATPYVRLGEWVPVMAGGIVLVAAGAFAVRRRDAGSVTDS
ncbi:apolipoprotein N-acyltransferase [Thermostaphylospora chromogena]|uniref:Apolipoprotein N-acyltransferase n=1 Tax=Thermostaphylospora chromogena TaxID=35622 RepID=A0A1H1AM35_9ACTN|nr:apolipoprotein N-acyltransferase [Thermostaphylospora chromogena]SDQ40758.1 apolipoprotein N-acyltransferase [Thermostaphylospora chromogena]